MKTALRVDRLVIKVALSIAALVLLSVGGGFYLINRHYRQNVEARFRQNAARQTALIRLALEHQMLQKDRRLIHRMASRFAKDPDIERVLIMDREGRIQFSSDPALRNKVFSKQSRTCAVCHRTDAARRSHSVVVEINGGDVLRGVEPVPNRPACYGCHDRKHRINGLIIVDVPVGRATTKMKQAVMYYTLGAGALALVLLTGIGLVFRRLITRRLRRLQRAARSYAAGDLDHRVPVSGNDMLTQVESRFNEMADSVGSLLKQLEGHRASLEKVMNSVDDGMVVLDGNRRIIAANDAFVQRFDVQNKDVMGLACCDVLEAGGLGCSCCEDEPGGCPTVACLESGDVQVTLHRRTDAEGQQRLEEVVASMVQMGDDDGGLVVEMWRDITDRQSTEARLAEYQRLVSIGMLASGISHEVNTPLATIGACLESIRELAPDADMGRDERWEQALTYASMANEQVRRCGSTTQQLLQLARGRSLEQEAVNLSETVELAVNLCRKRGEDSAVVLELQLPERPLSVYASPSAVQQVVINAVLNAIEASEAGQCVRVTVADRTPIAVTVRDEGAGIPSQDLPKIFEPFFTRKAHGTGLGLFVSMSLVRSWGGDIVVHSVEDEGTTLSIQFPRPGAA